VDEEEKYFSPAPAPKINFSSACRSFTRKKIFASKKEIT
jgi:hypothetical protein